MSQADKPSVEALIVNHEEAYELACSRRGESNLARCYLELRDKAEAQPVAQAKPVAALPEADLRERIERSLKTLQEGSRYAINLDEFAADVKALLALPEAPCLTDERAHHHEAWWLIESTVAPRPLYYAGHKHYGQGRTHMHMVEDAAQAVRFSGEWGAKYALAAMLGVKVKEPTWPLDKALSHLIVREHIFDYTPRALLAAQAPADRAVMQQALEALERCYDVIEWPANGESTQDAAIASLRTRIAGEGQ